MSLFSTMPRNLRQCGLLFSVLMTLCGCTSSGGGPFLIVQLCVVDESGLAKFSDILKSVARSEGMEFVDGSDTTQREFEAIRELTPEYEFTSPVIHMGINGPHGVGLVAANIGLRSYQIAVGFSEGSRPVKGRELAKMTVSALEEHWKVEPLPPGKGAEPMDGCGAAKLGR